MIEKNLTWECYLMSIRKKITFKYESVSCKKKSWELVEKVDNSFFKIPDRGPVKNP